MFHVGAWLVCSAAAARVPGPSPDSHTAVRQQSVISTTLSSWATITQVIHAPVSPWYSTCHGDSRSARFQLHLSHDFASDGRHRSHTMLCSGIAVVMMMALGSCCIVTCCNCLRVGAAVMVNYRNQQADPNSQGSEGQPTHGRAQRGMA